MAFAPSVDIFALAMDGPRGHKRIRALVDGGDARIRSLQDLLHIGGISIKGLADILKRVRDLDPADGSATALYEANLARFLAVRHIESVPMLKGARDFEWELAHPCRLLSTMIEECGALERLFTNAFASHPCSASRRWRLVVGFDEYVPGQNCSCTTSASV